MIIFKQRIKDYTSSVFLEEIDKKGYGLIMALIIGDKRYVDKEQKIRFKSAGVLHVMAVSGLHVGILYVFISGALFFMKRNKWLRLLRSLIIWFVLGFFAFVAGFSPSVVRSVWMFFLVDVGTLAAKKSSIYNIIAASAFTILVIDPHTVFEAGFWLSYCAVLSIITFFPFVKKIWNPGNKLLIKIRDLIALSLSVQPGTAALSIYLFNQFPLWFLLSNLIAVPLVGLIINLSFILLILDTFSVSMDWLFACLQFLLDLLDCSLLNISNLPAAVISKISLNAFELGILLIVAVLIGLLLWMREKRVFIPLLMLCNICFVSIVLRNTKRLYSSELVVFDSFGDPCVFIKEGQTGYWLKESESNAKYNLLEKYMAVNGIAYERKTIGRIDFSPCDTTSMHQSLSKLSFSGMDIPKLIRMVYKKGELKDYADIIEEWQSQNRIYSTVVYAPDANTSLLVIWGLNKKKHILLVDNKEIRRCCISGSDGVRIKICIQNTK